MIETSVCTSSSTALQSYLTVVEEAGHLSHIPLLVDFPDCIAGRYLVQVPINRLCHCITILLTLATA
jgi:hypothetical protein